MQTKPDRGEWSKFETEVVESVSGESAALHGCAPESAGTSLSFFGRLRSGSFLFELSGRVHWNAKVFFQSVKYRVKKKISEVTDTIFGE